MESRLGEFLNVRIGRLLARRERRESFATYAHDILADGERKSVEPMAARAAGSDDEHADVTPAVQCERIQARLLNFLRESPWDDRSVRREAARYVVGELQKQEPVMAWTIDDTGFPKQGKDSVGVQRQYSGTLGKIGNCQIGVSLTIATKQEHVPIDFALCMPASVDRRPPRGGSWRGFPSTSSSRRSSTSRSTSLHARSRTRSMGEIVPADAAYGASSVFRDTVRMFGLDHGVAVTASMKVWPLDKLGRRRGDPVTVQELGVKRGRRAFRKLTWREGPGGKLSSRFAFCPIKVANDDGRGVHRLSTCESRARRRSRRRPRRAP